MLSRDSQTIVLHEPDRSPRHQSLARRGNDPAARKLAVAAVCLSALMCVGVVVYTQLTAKATSDKLAWAEQELDYFRRVLHDQESPKQPNRSAEISKIAYRHKRSPNNRKTRRPRAHSTPSPAQQHPVQHSVPPYIHLVGNNRRHMEKDHIFFTWDKEDFSPGAYGFDLEGDTQSGYYKIKVKYQGVYLVYAQVAVHGRDNVNKPYECSHETVCTRLGNRTVLLGSLVTQLKLGGIYEKDENENTGLRALDTKIHMGVFMLQKDDVLSVQIPNSCENMEYSMTQEHSYFGLAKLNHHKETKIPKTKGNKGR